MKSLPEAAQDLTRAAGDGDRIQAWEATGRTVAWLSDLRNRIDETEIRGLVWESAATRRWFDIAEVLASAAAARADATPGLRRLHAQMLMERGFSDEALSRLQPLLDQTELSAYDRNQAFGHIARIYKDRFIAAVAAADEPAGRACLQRSIEAYWTAYKEDKTSVWHGINATALLTRPEALAVRRDAHTKAREIAAEVRSEVMRQTSNRYSAATMAETHIALGEYGDALEWVRRYISDPEVNAFMFGNFRRQLTQVWGLDRQPSPGPELVALVSAALLEKENGGLYLSGDDVKRARQITRTAYEAVFGADRFDSFENYRRGLERCTCVARIGRTADVGLGTGFVIPGKVLCARLSEYFVLVTNAHVISENEEERENGALHPSEAIVTFAALDGPEKEFALGKVLTSSRRHELDVTIAELAEPVLPKYPYTLAPILPARKSNSLVRIVGHPAGRGLSFSVNELLDHETPKLHYRTATEGGSSGSPVFNQDWKLIGLHHAGGDAVQKLNGESGTYEANEGIWIVAICQVLENALFE